MRIETLKCLACCKCHGNLKVESARYCRGFVCSGVLKCEECGLDYPVVLGRPVIMTSGMVKRWKSPVDEALGIDVKRTLFDSFDTLAELGLPKAICMAEKEAEQRKLNFQTMEEITEEEKGKIRYRSRGEWFRYGNRKERLLTFPWKSSTGEDSFERFMERIQESKPKVLLDLASGGGFGVTQQAFLNKTAECILSVERDLKCLGNIQYRFKHIKKEKIADAVGGDVRQIPVKSAVADTIMMLAGLPEIHGMGRLLEEVYRVLKPSGSFILLVGEEPFRDERFSPEEYSAFAEAADLYSGCSAFEKAAVIKGFKLKLSEHLSGGRRLLELEK